MSREFRDPKEADSKFIQSQEQELEIFFDISFDQNEYVPSYVILHFQMDLRHKLSHENFN